MVTRSRLLTTQDEILTINHLLLKDIAVFMFKQSRNKNPSKFSKIFVTNRSQYNIRNNSKIIPKFCSTNMCQQFISHRGPALWSKVPTSFKSQDLTIASLNLKMWKIWSKDLIQVWFLGHCWRFMRKAIVLFCSSCCTPGQGSPEKYLCWVVVIKLLENAESFFWLLGR